MSVCVRLTVCLSVRSSHISETSEVRCYQIELGDCLSFENTSIVTYIDLDKGHVYLNHESNKCSIVLETVQAMPIKFAVKIVRIRIFF